MEEERDWYPTANLCMCLGTLIQQWRRVRVEHRPYNGVLRRCEIPETEWRAVRQATQEEIADFYKIRNTETSPNA